MFRKREGRETQGPRDLASLRYPTIRTHALVKGLLAVTLLLASCQRARDEQQGGDTFRYAMVETSALDVAVTSAAGPVAGALVYVRSAEGGPPLWQGTTAADGHARGPVSFPATLERVGLVVQHPGFVGPWSAPQPRDTFGPFAPTSWTVLDARELAAHVVAVEARR